LKVHTTRLAAGETDPVAAATWINPHHIVRIDPCDSRDEHDGGELAMVLELSNGNELYVPLARTDEVEQAVACAVRDLLISADRVPSPPS
jgi:hypothetical protein